jgi:hypothetical protein
MKMGYESLVCVRVAQNKGEWRILVRTGFTKGSKFIDQLIDYYLLKNYFAPWI